MSASPNDTSSYRRNVPLLALAQGLFMTVQSMGTVTLPLAALAMLEQKWLATMPLFLNHAGIMVLTIPASLLMARIGRRWGFTVGATLSVSVRGHRRGSRLGAKFRAALHRCLPEGIGRGLRALLPFRRRRRLAGGVDAACHQLRAGGRCRGRLHRARARQAHRRLVRADHLHGRLRRPVAGRSGEPHGAAGAEHPEAYGQREGQGRPLVAPDRAPTGICRRR